MVTQLLATGSIYSNPNPNYSTVKNPNWSETNHSADHLAIYKRDLGVKLGGLPLRGQIQVAVIRAGIERRTSGIQFQLSNRSATPCPLKRSGGALDTYLKISSPLLAECLQKRGHIRKTAKFLKSDKRERK